MKTNSIEVKLDAEATQNVGRLSIMQDAVANVVISSDEDYETVAGMVKLATDISKRLDDKRFEITRPLDAAKKAAIDLFARPIGVATEIVRIGKGKMLAFHRAREQARRDAEAAAHRARAAATRVERENAERARREAELRAAAARESAEEQLAESRARSEAAITAAVETGDTEAATKAAEELDAAEIDAGRTIAQAETDRDIAIARADAPVLAPTPAVYVPPAPKVAGVSVRHLWRAEVDDIRKLVIAAAERTQREGVGRDDTLLALLDVNPAKLRALANALREHANVPGVRVFQISNVAAGGAP